MPQAETDQGAYEQAETHQGFYPSDHLQLFAAETIKRLGLIKAAALIGVASETAARIATGSPVRRGSLALAQLAFVAQNPAPAVATAAARRPRRATAR